MLLKSPKNKGFTLVELMVTIGIFIFMTGLIISRYDTYSSGSLLSNVAYDVALTIRQAQTYGISVKVADNSTTDYKAAYGVNFKRSLPAEFVLFADKDSLGTLNGGDETITKYNIKRGTVITAICAGSSVSCNPVTEELNISFRRPDPKAIICDQSGSCSYTYAKITVGNGGSSREVSVSSIGQVVVGN